MTQAPRLSASKRQIGFQLVGAGRRWRQTLDARLAQQGLSDAVWTSLIHLHRLGDGISQSELAASVGIEGSSLVRLLDTLVAQELVQRHPHATDRRIKQLYLTDAGRNTVSTIRKHLERIEDELLADLDEQEAAAVLRGLEKINQRIQRSHNQADE